MVQTFMGSANSKPRGKIMKFFELDTYCKGDFYIDDLGWEEKERTASNYGKSEVMARMLLEKRHMTNALLTHISCNYRETDHVGDLGGCSKRVQPIW